MWSGRAPATRPARRHLCSPTFARDRRRWCSGRQVEALPAETPDLGADDLPFHLSRTVAVLNLHGGPFSLLGLRSSRHFPAKPRISSRMTCEVISDAGAFPHLHRRAVRRDEPLHVQALPPNPLITYGRKFVPRHGGRLRLCGLAGGLRYGRGLCGLPGNGLVRHRGGCFGAALRAARPAPEPAGAGSGGGRGAWSRSRERAHG
jgi:hypothetical protein